jgi:NADPH-dependent glutamate synthase beta subunit-like oxidoreductase/Pyruvate/2-oxoacid:ferredoxin oxidoreductase delta subunit
VAKVVKKKKRKLGSLGASTSGGDVSPLRPVFVEKKAPCGATCPNNNAIRKMLMTISRAEELGKSYDEAFEEAFYIFLETTPFPAVCGRVCPHPCETECNRAGKDGAVSVNRVERFIGDFGIEKGLAPRMLADGKRTERVAVVGSGPGGLSAAYQLARRGYGVTVFEAFPKPGGMLRYGIPDYRLPADVLDAEIQRIVDMGVDLRLETSVGHDVTLDELRQQYDAVFVAIGAHSGIRLRIEGEDSGNVFTGTDFLHRVNVGEKVDIGDRVVVVGGGDTAIDAARVSRRLGANVTILYRRTREEMPAIDEEVEGALAEGVEIVFLAAPSAIHTSNGVATGMTCQRMELGEPDSSGRRRPVPIEGDTYDMEFTSLIAAVSQAPDFTGFDSLVEADRWFEVDERFATQIDGVYSGGDDTNLGLVVDAISHGRIAALAIHEAISGEPMPRPATMDVIRIEKMQPNYYPRKERGAVAETPVEERLGGMAVEAVATATREEAVAEAMRCMSCGECFECGTCWSYCQENAVIKPLVKGEPYKFKLSFCRGCSKCAEACPCGYIEMK